MIKKLLTCGIFRTRKSLLEMITGDSKKKQLTIENCEEKPIMHSKKKFLISVNFKIFILRKGGETLGPRALVISRHEFISTWEDSL